MLFQDSIARLRAPQVPDGYGNLRRDWGAATSEQLPAEVQPLTTDEDVVDQDRTTSRWRLFLYASADVQATDRIEWDDGSGPQTFEIDGEVLLWRRRRRPHHYEATLIRFKQG